MIFFKGEYKEKGSLPIVIVFFSVFEPMKQDLARISHDHRVNLTEAREKRNILRKPA